MISSPYTELARALRTRLEVIADRELYRQDPEHHLRKLIAASERIDEAVADLPRPLNGELAHYLQGCSYHKALNWLERNVEGCLTEAGANKVP